MRLNLFGEFLFQLPPKYPPQNFGHPFPRHGSSMSHPPVECQHVCGSTQRTIIHVQVPLPPSRSLTSVVIPCIADVQPGRVVRESPIMPTRLEEQLRTTLASIGDGVISTDPQGKVVFANKVAQSILRT